MMFRIGLFSLVALSCHEQIAADVGPGSFRSRSLDASVLGEEEVAPEMLLEELDSESSTGTLMLFSDFSDGEINHVYEDWSNPSSAGIAGSFQDFEDEEELPGPEGGGISAKHDRLLQKNKFKRNKDKNNKNKIIAPVAPKGNNKVKNKKNKKKKNKRVRERYAF